MYRVLIVEDEALIRQGLRFAVPWEKYGCEVIGEASGGEEGEEMVLSLRPDIVLTDIRMPGKTGLDMMRALEGRADCAYIILSGYNEFDFAKEAMKLGAKAYLLKPIDDGEMEDAILRTIRYIDDRRRYYARMLPEDVSEDRRKRLKEGMKDKYVAKACDILRERCSEDLTVRLVAEELNISASYLEKLFRSNTGYTFLNFLTFYRIKMAIRLLEESDMKVYHIAEAIGYTDSKYFSRTFQRIVGMKPTEYRGSHMAGGEGILDML